MRPPRTLSSALRAAVTAAGARAGGAWGIDEVDVWSASLDGQPPEVGRALEMLLAPDELERAANFRFERDRRRFVVARGILRTLLARYLGGPARAVALRYGRHGKPVLADAAGGEPTLQFNLAHSEGRALFAFTRAGPVGIDVERVRELPELTELAHAHLPPGECRAVFAAPPPARRDEFFRAWTRCEAAVKATGAGLGGAASGDVDLVLHPSNPESGYMAALAVGRAVRWCTTFTWRPDEDLPGAPDLPRDRRGRRIRLRATSVPGTDSR